MSFWLIDIFMMRRRAEEGVARQARLADPGDEAVAAKVAPPSPPIAPVAEVPEPPLQEMLRRPTAPLSAMTRGQGDWYGQFETPTVGTPAAKWYANRARASPTVGPSLSLPVRAGRWVHDWFPPLPALHRPLQLRSCTLGRRAV